MGLVLTEEQRMLRESARDFLLSRTPVSHLRQLRDVDDAIGFSRDAWRRMSELGWPAMAVPETHGGLGFGFTGLGVVLEEMGRTLTPTPLLSTAVMAVALLRSAASEAQAAELLPDIAAGNRLLALAVDENGRHEPHRVATMAVPERGGYRLRGHKQAVIDGLAADTLVVSARIAGNAGDAAGVSLFLVPASANGIRIAPREALDIGRLAEVTLDEVRLPAQQLIGGPGTGATHLDAALDAGRIGQSAELLGVALEAFERTIAYLKERKQFGVPIGSFQALQHRAAHLYGELELCKSMVLAALHALDEELPQLAEIASATKAKLSDVAMHVAAEAIQMHGGIGMTDEFDIGFFYKRARVLETLLGDRYFHLDRYARLRGY